MNLFSTAAPKRHTASTWLERVANSAVIALLLPFMLVFIGVNNAQAAYSACTAPSSGVPAETTIGDFKLTPSHGKNFYVDFSKTPNLNASYIGYQVKNNTGVNKSDVWVKVSGFSSGTAANNLLSLANVDDYKMQIPTIAAGETKTVYFLIAASRASTRSDSTTTQTHTVEIVNGDPDTTSPSVAGGCNFTFNEVTDVLDAAANKVTSVTINNTSPKLGELITVTAIGTPGTIGAGDTSATGDRDIVWLSPSAIKTFQTRAVRLERVSIDFGTVNSSCTQTFTDKLLITGVSACVQNVPYTATYSFRVIGSSPTLVTFAPIANIASGTQIKHSDASSASATLDLSGVGTNFTLAKTSLLADAVTVGSNSSVKYTITLTNTGTSDLTVDYLFDDPSAGVTFEASSASYTITDGAPSVSGNLTQGATSITPSVRADSNFYFVGPFTVPGSSTPGGTNSYLTLTYRMLLPLATTTDITYTNSASGFVGSQRVSSAASVAIAVDTVGAASVPGSYTVTYNANTASSGTVPTDSNTYATAASVTVLTNSGTLAKTGYTFAGWCTTQPSAGASCTGTSQAVSSTLTMGSANVTLYAVWTTNTLNVTFDTQGGSSISSTTTTTGASLSTPGTPTRAGYTFNGWFVASTGGSALTFAYAHGRTADFTLYAQWTLIAYSITYDRNFVGKPSDSVVSVNYGVDALLTKPTDPTRDGYTFAGWSETTSGSLITSFIVVGTKTFYAIWTPVPPAPILPPVTITWPNPSNIQYTTPLGGTQLNATAMCNGIAVSGTYTYSPALGSILEPGTYTLTVTFTPTSGSCSGASKTVQLVVEKQYPKITWKDALPIVIGTPLTATQLNALFSVPGTCVYTPALTTVLPVGTHTLSVTCTPTNGNLYFPVTTTVKIDVLPIEKSAVEPIVIPGNGPTTVPVPNEIQGSRSQVITLGPCLTSATINGARITYTPAPGCSGKTYITISTVVNGITTITTIPITILVVASPSKTGPITFTEGKIWWTKSPNAKSYEVTIWGQVVCTTTDLTCNVTRTIGPKTPVVVIAKGNDGLTATSNAVYENKKPLIATAVYFDTAKFKIKPEGEAEIKRVAAIIKKEGFTRLIIEGHTDSKGGVDNQALSNNRSKATAAAFKKLLPAISTKIQGSAFRKPAADNDTPEGMALNRRSEVLVW